MSRKRQAVAGGPHVPEIAHIEQIVATIFTKLPVTSLHSCKQAIKRWHELITSPQFTRLHFNSNMENNNKLMLYLKPSYSSSLILHLVDSDARITPYTTLQRLGRNAAIDIIVSVFNGLMCIASTGETTFVVNPATRRILRIPDGSGPRMPAVLCVVFDIEPCRYKIVRFYSLKRFHPKAHSYSCEVYCPERESWKQVGTDLPRPLRNDPYTSLPPFQCVGGRMYWFVWREEKIDHVMSVGMDEIVRRVELPSITYDATGYLSSMFTLLIGYRGSLGIFYLDEYRGRAGIYTLVDPEASEWRPVRFAWSGKYGPVNGINSIVEIGNELLFVMKFWSDCYYHFWYLNLDTMQWRVVGTGFLTRRAFRLRQICHQDCEARVFPFHESSFKCRGE